MIIIPLCIRSSDLSPISSMRDAVEITSFFFGDFSFTYLGSRVGLSVQGSSSSRGYTMQSLLRRVYLAGSHGSAAKLLDRAASGVAQSGANLLSIKHLSSCSWIRPFGVRVFASGICYELGLFPFCCR